jgi:ABC-type branched-subunit amino acid transport system ATPase component
LGASQLLTVESLVAGYGSSDILHGVSLAVNEGEIVSIIGPNGAGKSTLLKAVYGMADVRAGSVRVSGRAMTGSDTRTRLDAGVALVLQGRCNFPAMTVSENLEMGAFVVPGDLMEERRSHVHGLIPLLRDRSRAKAGQLSGGQQQLLEIGMMLMVAPRLLMLDEPTLGLDAANNRFVLDHVRQLAQSGLGILMVEQNARQALTISDRAMVLADGECRHEGSAVDVLDDPAVAALYLGTPEAGQ